MSLHRTCLLVLFIIRMLSYYIIFVHCHDITEILLKMALRTITLIPYYLCVYFGSYYYRFANLISLLVFSCPSSLAKGCNPLYSSSPLASLDGFSRSHGDSLYVMQLVVAATNQNALYNVPTKTSFPSIIAVIDLL